MIRIGRVIMVALATPVLVAAAVGVAAVAGETQLQELARELSRLLTFYGERVAYGCLLFAAVLATGIIVYLWREWWWLHHGESAANAILRDRIDEVRYKLRLKTRECAEGLAREQTKDLQMRAMLEQLGMADAAVGRAQIAARLLPAQDGEMRRVGE